MITLDTITDTDAFEALRPEWTDLLSASPADCVFLSWEWLFTWWLHLGGRRQLSVLTVRDDGQLIGIAPFVLARCSAAQFPPLRRVEFLGSGEAGSDYLDLIAMSGREQTVVAAVAAHLAGQGLVLSLTRLRASGSLARELRPALEGRAWTTARTTTDVCPYIDLRPHDWAAYLGTRTASHRYNFGRRLRALERHGATTFKTAVTDGAIREALDQLIAWHLHRWNQRGGSSAFHQPALLAFHDAFSRLALARGWLRLYTLTVGAAPVAVLYCLRYGTTTHFYQSGFDEAWTRWSVGLVAMGLAIKASIEDGAEQYDLLHGDEPYKFLWADRTHTLERLELYPAHAFGALCRRAMALKRAARRTVASVWSTLPRPHVQSPS